jgi:hypothetical protein
MAVGVGVERAMPAVLGTRDVFVDLLRTGSVALVILGHWTSSTIWWWEGRVGANSALAEQPWLAPASWVTVAVPVLFFAGGFANITCHRIVFASGGSSWTFVASRVRRLLAPTLLFLAVWFVVELILHAIGVGGDGIVVGVSPRGLMPFGPLWFLAIYFVLIALCPITVRLHDRFGLAMPVALVLSAVVVEAVRFGLDVPAVGWVNLVLAWLLPHQLGFCYADGLAGEGVPRVSAALCVAGAVSLVALTSSSLYPTSIGGVPGDEISNMRPPTLVIVALSLWQVGLVLMLRPRAMTALRSSRLATAVSALNRHAMSLYLWHMTALLIITLLLAPFGLSHDHQPIASFWLQRPLVLGLAGAMLAVLVKVAEAASSSRGWWRPTASRLPTWWGSRTRTWPSSPRGAHPPVAAGGARDT